MHVCIIIIISSWLNVDYQESKALVLVLVYMVLDARLVSSCLSFPSSARPLFSLLLHSSGVRV